MNRFRNMLCANRIVILTLVALNLYSMVEGHNYAYAHEVRQQEQERHLRELSALFGIPVEDFRGGREPFLESHLSQVGELLRGAWESIELPLSYSSEVPSAGDHRPAAASSQEPSGPASSPRRELDPRLLQRLQGAVRDSEKEQAGRASLNRDAPLPLRRVEKKAPTDNAGAAVDPRAASSALAPASVPRRAIPKDAHAPEIIALAQSFGDSPGRTFRFVHDEIDYDPKWGAGDSPLTFTKAETFVDFPGFVVGLFHATGTPGIARATMELAGAQGSFLEGEVFNQVLEREGIAAVSALTFARREGQTLTLADGSNLDSVLASVELGADVENRIRRAVDEGRVAWLPETPIQVNQWRGTGYVLEEPTTGAAAYLISGGWAGGSETGAGIGALQDLLGSEEWLEGSPFGGLFSPVRFPDRWTKSTGWRWTLDKPIRSGQPLDGQSLAHGERLHDSSSGPSHRLVTDVQQPVDLRRPTRLWLDL
jgi:hypothetical protein